MQKSNRNITHGYFTILNDRGLHCRPSAEIVRCATLFKSNIFLNYRKTRVNAKSLFGILTLAAAKGARIKIEAEGVDAEAAVSSLLDLAEKSFLIAY